MAPFDVNALSGTVGYALVFGAVGFGFGAVLEMAGFGDTRKLAAQFYLTEMTVLKVMFTAIVVAAVLLALASGFGFLDMSRVFVNPTFLPSESWAASSWGWGSSWGGSARAPRSSRRRPSRWTACCSSWAASWGWGCLARAWPPTSPSGSMASAG